MGMTKDQWKNVSQSEILVALVQIASENADLKSQLKGILGMDAVRRKDLLEELLADLRSKDAPRSVVKAIAMLSDDTIARQTLDLLNEVRE